MTVGLLVPGVLVASPASALSAPPPTLSGETLQAQGNIGVVRCGGSGSFSFTTAGTATGPYPGTFTETGSGTVNGDELASFTATFTIDSPTGTVTGTKTFTGGGASACYQDPDNFYVLPDSTTYQATIHTPSGNYTDQGTSATEVYKTTGTVGFSEAFSSSLSQPTLIQPTSKSQCKNGGYKNFPQFRTQGQCVTYVDSQGG